MTKPGCTSLADKFIEAGFADDGVIAADTPAPSLPTLPPTETPRAPTEKPPVLSAGSRREREDDRQGRFARQYRVRPGQPQFTLEREASHIDVSHPRAESASFRVIPPVRRPLPRGTISPLQVMEMDSPTLAHVVEKTAERMEHPGLVIAEHGEDGGISVLNIALVNHGNNLKLTVLRATGVYVPCFAPLVLRPVLHRHLVGKGEPHNEEAFRATQLLREVIDDARIRILDSRARKNRVE